MLDARFWDKVKLCGSHCWEWLAGKDSRGYGHFGFEGNNRYAHRIAWEASNGPVPKGLELDHLCRNRGCVNPGHLEAVTHIENMRRGSQAMKTHCIRGHLLAGDNLIHNVRGRRCKVCKPIYNRRYRQRAK